MRNDSACEGFKRNIGHRCTLWIQKQTFTLTYWKSVMEYSGRSTGSRTIRWTRIGLKTLWDCSTAMREDSVSGEKDDVACTVFSCQTSFCQHQPIFLCHGWTFVSFCPPESDAWNTHMNYTLFLVSFEERSIRSEEAIDLVCRCLDHNHNIHSIKWGMQMNRCCHTHTHEKINTLFTDVEFPTSNHVQNYLAGFATTRCTCLCWSPLDWLHSGNTSSPPLRNVFSLMFGPHCVEWCTG